MNGEEPVAYALASHWDRVHAHGSAAGQGGAARALLASVRSVLAGRLRAGDRVLDLACGRGELLAGLPAATVRIGVDISPGALATARRRASLHGAVLLRAGAGRLPLATGSIDAAACVSSLWALPDAAAALGELARVLRRGGVLALHLWGPAGGCRLITLGAAAIARALPAARRPESVTGPFELTPASLAATLDAAGFGSVAWREHRYGRAIPDAAAYWAEFAGLAPTAYAAYRQAEPRRRARIDELVGRLLAQSRERGGDTLAVRWLIATVTR